MLSSSSESLNASSPEWMSAMPFPPLTNAESAAVSPGVSFSETPVELQKHIASNPERYAWSASFFTSFSCTTLQAPDTSPARRKVQSP